MATATETRNARRIAPVINRPDAKPKKAREPKPCACGCGAASLTGTFRVGHDAKLKSRLLQAARTGDAAARAELLERGWATEDSIDNAKAKLSEQERAERRIAKLRAKAERLTAELNEIEAQIGAASAVPVAC